MKKIQVIVLFALFNVFWPLHLKAERRSGYQVTKPARPLIARDTDVVSTGKKLLIERTGKLNQLNPSVKFRQVRSAADAQVKRMASSLDERLKKLQNRPLSLDLSVENATRFQPGLNPLSVYPNQSLINEFMVTGVLNVYGIPLNLNYTNAKASYGTSTALRNDLFKFDFDPKQFSGLFKSDFQQYYDLRKTAFGGMDINSYVRQAALTTLKSKTASLSSSGSASTLLTKYLSSNKTDIGELLTLDESQLKQKLLSAANQTPALKDKITGGLNSIKDNLPVNINQSLLEKTRLQTEALTSIANNKVLADYMGKPALAEELNHLSEEQIKERLTIITADRRAPTSDYINNIKIIVPTAGIDLSEYVKEKIRAKSEAKNLAIENLAYKIASSQLASIPVSPSDMIRLSASENSRINSEKLGADVESAVSAISKVKNDLREQGYDPGKLVQMQKYLDGNLPSSEATGRFFTKKPTSSLQSLFNRFQELKLGSFGTKVPGGTQNQDIFAQGTHVTFKSNNTPITAGYGNINDVSSLKDASFQSSVYNSPKAITYIGADVNTSAYGKVKIAVVSSFNSPAGLNNNSYAMPSLQGNSTAVTLSRSMDMGNIGDVSVDVSKSNTLYNNNYVQGSEAILARKAGISNSTMDLFQSVAVGFNQHREIKELNMTDNVYFNFAGMGYQNPGNNGYGGARMKLGGNLKKTLYKNKLVLNLRTDIRNMPISYTSDDKWKNYQVSLDSRYQVNKKLNISLKYSANGTSRKVDDLVSPVYSFQKIQFDGNSSFKIGKNSSVSHFSISKQDYRNSYVSQSAGNMLMLNYTQTLMLHKNSLTASIFYNKELSAYKLIGNMLNSDLSYQFRLFDKLNFSTGATYLDNTGIAKQAGLRQSIQFFSGKKFDVDSYLDVRKNLIASVYPDLYSACRAELRLKYHL